MLNNFNSKEATVNSVSGEEYVIFIMYTNSDSKLIRSKQAKDDDKRHKSMVIY